MKWLIPGVGALLLAGCLGPLELPEFPPDDDDSALVDDDDTGPDDDDIGPDDDDATDDDDAVDDDDTVPLDESGGGQRICAEAGTASNGSYTVRTCTGPVVLGPGVVTNGTYTIRINKLNTIAK